MRKPAPPFWTLVRPHPNGCWLWGGTVDHHGYGRYRMRLAHRLAYLELAGEIPDGLELDHLCRVPACVNPNHLEPVSHAENVRRSIAGQVNSARLRTRTHCKNGHPFSAENTYVYPNGYRECRICARANHKRLQSTPEYRAWHLGYQRTKRSAA